MSQLLEPPLTQADEAPVPRRGAARPLLSGTRLEVGAVLGLVLLAGLIRLPYLSDIPRYTDELQEVLWSLDIARGAILPLTAVDSYYGPLWSYLLAGLFKLFGPSPTLPRLTALVIGAGFVGLTYGFARSLAGRWVAFIAAGLLATSPGHIIINSHTARSNSTTPLFTTAALWLVCLALEDRVWDVGSSTQVWRRPDPRLLVPAGLLLGLALQTHISVVALAPGLAAYVVWRRPRLLRSPWAWLALGAAALGYANMIVFNLLNNFWSFRHASSLQAGYTGGRSTDLAFYTANLESLVQSLARLLSGTIETSDSPTRFLYMLLAGFGLALLARRGGALLVFASLSIILVLPYFNPRYGPILSGRYLIPLLPLAFTGIGVTLVWSARWIAERLRGPAARWQPAAASIGLALALLPLLSLRQYYLDALADGRTNAPLDQLAAAAVTARAEGEVVLLDEGLAQEALGAGGTDLKALRMLLGASSVPNEVAKVAEIAEPSLGDRGSALLIAEAKKRGSLARSIRATPLSREVASASGSEHSYVVYRLAAR